jgi:2-succinyl-6-hydroxy-2,4-cyclohexadiene-1-carboxylate synthase
LIALHGFLGRGSDWDTLLPADTQKVDWLPMVEPRPDLLQFLADQLVALAPENGTLVGYSMGGRIALMMLTRHPKRFRRAVIISASPGLRDDEDRSLRHQSDARWARRFTSGEWDLLMADWNAQPVFASDPPPPLAREEADYDRQKLAWAVEYGSVAHQPDLRETLREATIPILWVAGENDRKYADLAEECAALNPKFELAILPRVGHRAPWTAPNEFRAALTSFINREN